ERQMGVEREANSRTVVGEYREAERANATLDPRDTLFLAGAYLNLGMRDEAIGRAEGLPESAETFRTRIYKRVIERELALPLPEYDRAIELLSRLLGNPDLPPEDRVWALARQTEVRLSRGYTDEAITRLLRALPLMDEMPEPLLGELYLLLGEAYAEKGLLDEAGKHFARADRMLPQGVVARARLELRRAVLDGAGGRTSEARERYASVARQFARSVWELPALLGLGETEALLGEHRASIEAYRTLVELLEGGEQSKEATPERVSDSLLARFTDSYASGRTLEALEYAGLVEDLYGVDETPVEGVLAIAQGNLRRAEELGLEVARPRPALQRGSPGGDDTTETLDPASRAQVRRHLIRAGAYFHDHADRVVLGDNAAFAASTDTTGTFAMTGDWYLDAIDADAPVAHWRLDDTVTGGGSSSTVLVEDFESPVVFTQFGTGQVAASTTQARSGTTSAHKTTNNDPNGASLPLPVVVTDSFTFEVWVYRPSSFSGGSIDRLGIEDATFGGYTFNADHNGNSLRIDRRDGGNATGIGVAVTFNPPEDEWYRLRLQRDGASLSLAAYDTTGALLAATSANDGTYTSFDRMTIRGGHDYFVDDVTVTQDPTTTLTAIDRIGTEDGVIDGIPTGGAPSLLQNLPGSASAFDLVGSAAVLIGDDALINTTDRDERTVELWFEADSISGRQVLYEEGGTVNGLSVYLDGGQLYGRAWSQSTSWSNALTATSSPGAITPGQRYHVAVVLDAAIGRDLELHLNGTVVDTATKTDANTWNRHTDDGAIGRVNGGTQFHDGNSSAASYFDGVVDEVVLFNTALDADRVEAHWFAGR
ncbi:MAG: LamG-like jellyroll fold domain-containing protein, partial [Actinomycetota bacterium]